MSEWQIEREEYFERLNLSIEDFKCRLNLPNVEIIKKIIPLRDIKNIESLVPISLDLLGYLIGRVKTLDGELPFEKAKIRMIKIDPRQLKIGQKFVYRETYQGLLEEVPDIFHRFLVSAGGLGDLGAYFVFGPSNGDSYDLACYIPPLIEKHGQDLVIMDGIHRNFIAKQAGLTLNAILIEDISLSFPCRVEEWPEIKIISLSQKPKDINERYFNLQKGLFRDLKYLGIDG